jgi:adenylate cyclase
VRAERTEPFLGRYLSHLSEQGEGGPTYSLGELAERSALDAGTLERVVEAASLGGSDQVFSDDDVSLLRGLKVILESGLSAEALVQLLRVYSEALSRVAEAEARLFHFYVHEWLRSEGASGPDLAARTEAARSRMMPFVEPTILYFHRKGFARAVEDDAVPHLQEDTGLVVRDSSDSPWGSLTSRASRRLQR